MKKFAAPSLVKPNSKRGRFALTFSLVTVAFQSASFGLETPAEARGAQVIPLQTVFGGQLMFSADVAGERQLFLLDTGGGLTVIAPKLAAQVGCEPWGQLTGYRMRGERTDVKRCENFSFKVAGLNLSTATAGVFGILEGAPADTPPIVGSAALDMFEGKTITLDVGHKTITIETPESLRRRLKGARPVVARFKREVQGMSLSPLIAVETARGRIWLEVDSGSDGDVIINRSLAAALGADPANKKSQNLQLKLAGGVGINTSGHVEDLVIDGNIGVRVLKHWIVTIDTKGERIWLAPSGL